MYKKIQLGRMVPQLPCRTPDNVILPDTPLLFEIILMSMVWSTVLFEMILKSDLYRDATEMHEKYN